MKTYQLRLAVLLAFVLHGVLILTARYRLSYDAYTHMLFADHYRQNWWSLWDPTWYTGFTVTSYPPLIHQLIGLLGLVIGVDAGYALISWAVLAAFPIAVYAFSRVFVDPILAEHAALAAAILPSIYLAAYTFGQLPFLTGTLLALFFAAALAEFLKTGRRLSGALATVLVAVILGAHHATLMLLPFLTFAVGLHIFLNQQVGLKALLTRLAILAPAAGIAGLLVIWPFWRWGLGQVMQTPIDHGSRHNFITDPAAGALFFLATYGPLIILIPTALRKITDRRFSALSAVFVFLFLLGLGGTTPLPQWLFGAGWAWLTYDRFALWATLFLLPFLGVVITPSVQPGLERVNVHLIPPFQRLAWSRYFSGIRSLIARNRIWTAFFGSLVVFSILVSNFPTILPTQPNPVDMQPIVQFLAQGDRSQWRYLTFGFGDQFAYLNRLTSATTIDGEYHTARTLPELRSSGIGSINSVYWLAKDLKPLDPILQSSGKYGVRWGFVDNPAYVPALIRNGWVENSVLSNGIQVWENPAAVLLAPMPVPVDNPLESFSWGTLPILALAVTTGLAGLRLRPALAVRALEKVYTIAIGLLPIGLVLWYFRPLTNINYPGVYFAYDNAGVFLSDAIALIAVLVWILTRWFRNADEPDSHEATKFFSLASWLTSIASWVFALCCLASLSVLWSKDWRVSLYLSLHLWLGFGLFLSLRDRSDAWQAAMIGFCAALGIEIITGFPEFVFQSTRLFTMLNLNWPGGLDPSIRGASVVQLLDGSRWLRVYGTLPHPNILGTFTVALLSGPAAIFLLKHRGSVWTILLFSGGLGLLILSFSRGAWVGFFISSLIITIKFRTLERKRLLHLITAGGVSLMAAVLPLKTLIYTRIAGAASIPTEAFSILGREWLAGQAVGMIQQHLLLGIGVGSFILNLAERALPGYIIEPAHSLPLLVVSELGLGGAVVLLGLAAVIARRIWQNHNPKAVLISAALVGLCTTSLFDHSLWTLAPGRIFLAMVLGLWAGQVERGNR